MAQTSDAKTEELFKEYIETDNNQLAKKIVDSDDGVYSLYGQALFINNVEEKINLYSRFINQNPKIGLDKAYLNRGIEYYLIEKLDSAFNDFDKSIDLNKKEPYTYYFRGVCYVSIAMFDEALADYSKAIKLKPDFKQAYLMRGNAYFEQKNYKKALLDYNKILDLDPKHSATYLTRGKLYEAMGEYHKAIIDWQMVKILGRDKTTDVDMLIEEATKKWKK